MSKNRGKIKYRRTSLRRTSGMLRSKLKCLPLKWTTHLPAKWMNRSETSLARQQLKLTTFRRQVLSHPIWEERSRRRLLNRQPKRVISKRWERHHQLKHLPEKCWKRSTSQVPKWQSKNLWLIRKQVVKAWETQIIPTIQGRRRIMSSHLIDSRVA